MTFNSEYPVFFFVAKIEWIKLNGQLPCISKIASQFIRFCHTYISRKRLLLCTIRSRLPTVIYTFHLLVLGCVTSSLAAICIFLRGTFIMTSTMEPFSALLAFCEGNHRSSRRSVTQSFDVLFDLRLNNGWANNGDAGELKRHGVHYDVTLMRCTFTCLTCVVILY